MGAKLGLYACCFLLLLAMPSAISYNAYLRERKEIVKLCRDVTESDELQLSFECADRMKISSPKDKQVKSGRFMGVR